MTETEHQNQIIDLAHLYGWKVAHFRPAWSRDGKRCMTAVQADGTGWPDLTLVKGSRLIFAEVKSDKGKVSSAQAGWLTDLKMTGHAEVYLWRPEDWSEIQEVLTR